MTSESDDDDESRAARRLHTHTHTDRTESPTDDGTTTTTTDSEFRTDGSDAESRRLIDFFRLSSCFLLELEVGLRECAEMANSRQHWPNSGQKLCQRPKVGRRFRFKIGPTGRDFPCGVFGCFGKRARGSCFFYFFNTVVSAFVLKPFPVSLRSSLQD